MLFNDIPEERAVALKAAADRISKGECIEALAILESLEQEFPNNVSLLFTKAYALYAVRCLTTSRRYFSRVLELCPGDGRSIEYIAKIDQILNSPIEILPTSTFSVERIQPCSHIGVLRSDLSDSERSVYEVQDILVLRPYFLFVTRDAYVIRESTANQELNEVCAGQLCFDANFSGLKQINQLCTFLHGKNAEHPLEWESRWLSRARFLQKNGFSGLYFVSPEISFAKTSLMELGIPLGRICEIAPLTSYHAANLIVLSDGDTLNVV